MRRRLFNILAAVSLVMCIGFAGMWCRSNWIKDQWRIYRISRDDQGVRTIVVHLDSQSHGLGLFLNQDDVPYATLAARGLSEREWSSWKSSFRWEMKRNVNDPYPRTGAVDWAGFGFGYKVTGVSFEHTLAVALPYWMPTAVSAILPLCWYGKRKRRDRRKARGHCLVCGYNLTGNVSGVCPECGTAIPLRAAAEGAIT